MLAITATKRRRVSSVGGGVSVRLEKEAAAFAPSSTLAERLWFRCKIILLRLRRSTTEYSIAMRKATETLDDVEVLAGEAKCAFCESLPLARGGGMHVLEMAKSFALHIETLGVF